MSPKSQNDDQPSLYHPKKHVRGTSARNFKRARCQSNLTSEYHFKPRKRFCNEMAQAFLLKVLVLAFILCPLCQTQSYESASVLHDANQASTSINEKSESFPAGCRLYQNRKLLQCRNAGLQTIPELKEEWEINSV